MNAFLCIKEETFQLNFDLSKNIARAVNFRNKIEFSLEFNLEF